jgi:phage regulator Rha-like protein
MTPPKKDALVTVTGKEPTTTTLAIAEGTAHEHRTVIQLVRIYIDDLNEFGRVTFQIAPFKTAGGTQSREIALLNEPQATLLITYMKNSEVVRAFKKTLVREFYRMRSVLVQAAARHENAAWLEQRKLGKETRLLTTDTIKEFTEYATAQGSTNAAKYYGNLTVMENKALFLLEMKYKNIRNLLDLHQLSTVKSADAIVMKALVGGMAQGLHYKDIYLLAKKRVEGFAEIIGKSVVPIAALPSPTKK